MRALPKNFNDTLTLVIVLAFFVWIGLVGAGRLPATPEVAIGAVIALLGNVGQYYYRKAGKDDGK